MPYLSDSDRQALRLASELRRRMQGWLNQRGVPVSLLVSPFVDRTGQASVLIRMNTHAALALIAGFEEQRFQARKQRLCAPYQVRIWPPNEERV
ncbi:hypothetical protein ACGFIV_34390 [Sphaerisporangium sp. NPDC049003]|uniref:hypothetical protein n=1 Tax=Sphaerisporangium sp. NPDC049003 TaxID=3364517 RepID=UPI003718F4E2